MIHNLRIPLKAVLVGVLFWSGGLAAEAPPAFRGVDYLGKIEPRSSTEIGTSPWGIHFNGMPFHDDGSARWEALDREALLAELPVLIERTVELGVKWARISVDWPLIEDMEGNFHWELLDPMIHGLSEAGITVYPSLHGGHDRYTKTKAPLTEEEIQAWLNFAGKVVSRYAEEIDYWEIWNEPNTVWFWAEANNPAQYFRLVEAASPLIKQLDPGAKVIGGNMARMDVPYAAELFRMGIAEHIEVLSFHPYGVFPEASLKSMDVQVRTPLLYEPVMNPVSGFWELIEGSGKDIALWQGECGYPSAMNSLGWTGTGPFGEKIQAKWILRRLLTDMAMGADVGAVFTLKEIKKKGGDRINSKGLLAHEDLRMKPGYTTLQSLCAVIQGELDFDRDWGASVEILDEGGMPGAQPKDIQFLSMEINGRSALAYWAVTHMQEETVPGRVNLTLTGVADVQRVEWIDLISGTRWEVQEAKSSAQGLSVEAVPLMDYPLLLVFEE